MGSVYRKAMSLPLPPGATIVEIDGALSARWVGPRGKILTHPAKKGRKGQYVLRGKSDTWFVRYRDANGDLQEVSTGTSCKEDAVLLLVSLESAAEAEYEKKNAVPPRLLTSPEAAKWLRVSERTLYSLVSDQEIRVVRIRGSVRFDLADLEEFLEARKTPRKKELT